MEQAPVRVLLVDDDRGDYLLVRDMLAEVGAPHQLEWADGYESGLALVRAGGHDVYLLDYRLGQESGLDLLREAVAAGCAGSLILLTGQGDRETDLAAMRAGADDYLPKGQLTGALLERTVRYAVERKAAQERLRLRDRALEAISQGLCIVERRPPAYPVVYANVGLERLTGYPREGLKEGTLFAGPQTDPVELARLWDAIRQGVPAAAELLGYRKDGTTFWTAVSVSPFASTTGLGCCACVFTDLSEHRRLEEQLRQAQKMEAVGRLAGGVAHDFNNTMTIVIGFGELVLAGLGEGHPLAAHVRDILRAADRAANLTAQLLAFGRKSMIAPRVLDLNVFLGEMVPMLARLIGEDVRLEVALRAAAGAVKADPGQLHQLVLNLALNARDAMPGGGRLVLETALVDLGEEEARAKAARPGPYVRFSVRDTGQGMSEEVRAHLFEPFYTTKEVGKGTGLGLAVVHGIVQQSGGHIEVQSRQGSGSVFHIFLPQAEPERQPARAREESASWPRGTETVLLAEDEPAVRSVVASVLRQCGYAVLEACDGIEALRVAREHVGTIHLLLTDVVMPRMSGGELAARLAGQRPALRILYLSAHAEDEVLRRGLGEGVIHFLAKPFRIDELARKVREVLDGKP